MTALTALYDLVLPDLPRCPEALAMAHIRLACEEFYSRTLCKRAVLASISTVADTSEYALTLPEGYVADKVLHVWLDDLEINPIGMDDRDGLDAEWRTTTGEPSYYYMPDTENIGLFLTPDAVYTVAAEVALKPKSDATTIDGWVYEQYREALAAGAKARLMAMAGKPWTSNLSAKHQADFDRAIGKATHDANRGHGRAQKRTRCVFGLR